MVCPGWYGDVRIVVRRKMLEWYVRDRSHVVHVVCAGLI